VHAHLVIPGAKVKFGEEGNVVEFIEKLIHDRDGELVLDGVLVQGSVVDAEVSRFVLLLDEDGRRERGGAWPDHPLLQHFVALD
jgi:hypothetical protein